MLAEVASNVPIHDIHGRRRLGAFYTPIKLTEILCDWAITEPAQKILEPCFGGCQFLDSAILRFRQLGNARPAQNLFGCDIDPIAFEHLGERFGSSWPPENFHRLDFLKTELGTFGTSGFDSSIGNPPYIRHSQFSDAQREAVSRWRDANNFSLDKKAGLWVYFLLHALTFLNNGGKLAWVLPGSFITSQYSAAVREFIAARFERVLAVCLGERLFLSEGTEERSVLLLAEGYQQQTKKQMHVSHCQDISKIKGIISHWAERPDDFDILGTNANESAVPPEIRSVMQEIAGNNAVTVLGDMARVKIGLVTGNNKFFIKSSSAWQTLNIPRKNLRAVIPRIAWLQGIVLNPSGLQGVIDNDAPCLMLDTSRKPWGKSLQDFLLTYPEEKLNSTATFKKREDWHYPFDDQTPDAFLAYITHFGPRLVVNRTDVNATNSLYRVFFAKGVTLKSQKLAAISIHTTFSQLWAEAVGRACGAGALKLEPSEVIKIPLIMPDGISGADIQKVFGAMHRHLSNNDNASARKLADDFLFPKLGPNAKASLLTLKSGLKTAHARRMRPPHE